MKRPVGVTILAILAFIGGILSIIAGVLSIAAVGLLASVNAAGATAGTSIPHYSATYLYAIGGASAVLGVLYIVLGVGFWGLKPWAWTMGIGLGILGLILDVVQIVQGASITSELISIVFSLIILFYLFTPGVRKAFGRG